MGRLLTKVHPQVESEVELGELLAQMVGLERDVNAGERNLSAIERITQGTQVELNDQLDEREPNLGRDPADASEGRNQEQTEENNSEQANRPSNEQDVVDDEIQNEAAVPVFGHGQGQDQGASLEQSESGQFVMSTNDFLDLQDRMTEEDKMDIFAIVLGSIPPEQFQSVSLWFEDGLTSQEITNIYQLLDEYLTDEELTELASILEKYE